MTQSVSKAGMSTGAEQVKVNGQSCPQSITPSEERKQIMQLMEERKLRYQADRIALQREQKELTKEYRRQNREMNRRLKELATDGYGSPKKACYALNRQLGQMLLTFNGKSLDTANASCQFNLQPDQVVFTITINVRKEGAL